MRTQCAETVTALLDVDCQMVGAVGFEARFDSGGQGIVAGSALLEHN